MLPVFEMRETIPIFRHPHWHDLLCADNRDIEERLVRKLERSTLAFGYLYVHPIGLQPGHEPNGTDDLVVIGQHRFVSSLKTGIEPWFVYLPPEVTPEVESKVGQAVVAWGKVTTLRFHARRGDVNCQRILDLLDEFHADYYVVTTACGVCCGAGRETPLIGPDLIAGGREFLQEMGQLLSFVPHAALYKGHAFIGALRAMPKAHGFDRARFRHQLAEHGSSKYRECRTVAQAAALLTDIYNFGIYRRNRIACPV